MRLPAFAAVVWQTRQAVESLGRTGLLVVGVIAATVVVYLNVIQPLEVAVADARSDTEVLRSRLATRHAERQSDDPGAQLVEFYSRFPSKSSALDAIESLFDAAVAANVSLDRTEYRLTTDPSGGLARYDMVVPIKARYGQVRRFLAEVVSRNPNLALDGVTFSRSTAGDIGIDAQLHLVLYIRDSQ